MNNKTDIDVQYISPLKKICMTIGELPSSYLETMSYYEMLVWFTEFLKNKVVPAVNNNAEAVQELQSLYEELRTYVNNYFDNLDVQEEINNKLDEMAESGQLTDIIAQYLGLAGMIAFDTVSDMKLAQNLVNGSKCRTLGFHSVNDGGGAYYKIRQVTNDDVIDEMNIIEVYDDTLVAELILNEEVTPEQFGAYGDGTHDDSTSFVTSLKSGKPVIANKTYLFNSQVNLAVSFKLTGNGKITGYGLAISKNALIDGITFEDIEFNAIEQSDEKLVLNNCKFNRIGINENNQPTYQGAAVFTTANEIKKTLVIDNCSFKYCHAHGAIFCNKNNSVNIKNSYFEKNYYRGISIYSTQWQNYDVDGIIENNYIIDCGQPNTTGSGVGCNGILCTNGRQLDVKNNIIIDSYENGIEGSFKSITGNLIDTTGKNTTTHPTPSIEGIYFYTRNDCLISGNILRHTKRRGICFGEPTLSSLYNVTIENNIIDSVTEVSAEHYSIYVNATTVENMRILDNKTNDPIFVYDPSFSNCIYSGDIKLLTTSANKMNVVSNYNNQFYYSKNFNDYSDWTYSNCVPSIVTDGTIGNKVVSIPYQQWNRFVSPQLPYYKSLTGKMRIYCKGNFDIQFFNNDTWNSTVTTIDDSTYTWHEINFRNTGDGQTEKFLRFICKADSEIDIQSITLSAQYY